MSDDGGDFSYVSLGDDYPKLNEEIERRKRNGTWGKDYLPPPAKIPDKYENTIWDILTKMGNVWDNLFKRGLAISKIEKVE
jgi:hypothetical protein